MPYLLLPKTVSWFLTQRAPILNLGLPPVYFLLYWPGLQNRKSCGSCLLQIHGIQYQTSSSPVGLFFSFFFRTFHKKILNATIKPRFCLLHFCKDDWTSISYYLLATYSSISDFVSHDSNNIVCLRDVICLVISNPSYFLSSVSISLNLKQWTLNPCKSPYCSLWDFSFFYLGFWKSIFLISI